MMSAGLADIVFRSASASTRTDGRIIDGESVETEGEKGWDDIGMLKGRGVGLSS
jgi:hypothetical protein